MGNNNTKGRMELVMGILMLVILYLYGIYAQRQAADSTYNQQQDTCIVLLDAGHGGNDPGKVSLEGCLEKDLNLKIAMKLKAILESQDIQVVMTRTEDKGLYEESDSNKKAADMRKRVALAKEVNADILVSVHMNSYTSPEVCGGQVFYYATSKEGKELAEDIQKEVSKVSVLNSKRSAKANDNYYMLRNSSVPAIIVECGFLSNPEEAALLKTEEYQEKIAWAIHMGIMKYFNKNK